MFSAATMQEMYRATGGKQATADWFVGGSTWGHFEDGSALFEEQGTVGYAKHRRFTFPTANLARDPVNESDTLVIAGTAYMVLDHGRSGDGLDTILSLGDT